MDSVLQFPILPDGIFVWCMFAKTAFLRDGIHPAISLPQLLQAQSTCFSYAITMKRIHSSAQDTGRHVT